jgi:hypothetical protein
LCGGLHATQIRTYPHLSVGDVVDGGDAAVLDAQLLEHHLIRKPEI